MTNNKKVLITGASRGIGQASALKLLNKGYQVIGTATSNSGVDLLTKEGIIGLKLDLNSNKSLDEFARRIKKDFSDILILINNAGITKDNLVLRMSNKEWTDIINIHLNGVFKISKITLKFMLKARWGRIINITSTSASTGNQGQSNYASAKAGIEAFSKSLASEVGSRSITVNSIAPGFINTDMTAKITEEKRRGILKQIPLSRFGNPDEVAELVEFLVSDEASYITGQTIHLNGGLFI